MNKPSINQVLIENYQQLIKKYQPLQKLSKLPIFIKTSEWIKYQLRTINHWAKDIKCLEQSIKCRSSINQKLSFFFEVNESVNHILSVSIINYQPKLSIFNQLSINQVSIKIFQFSLKGVNQSSFNYKLSIVKQKSLFFCEPLN